MTTMIESDTRGIDALTGQTGDNVEQLPPLLWNQLTAEWGEMPERPYTAPFDDEPWQQLPTIEDLEELWLTSPLISIMVHKLAAKVHGDGEDLPMFIARQRELAYVELRLKREREAADATGEPVHAGGSGGAASHGAAAALGGGGDVPRKPKNRNKVGKSRKTPLDPNAGKASPVHGWCGVGPAA